MLIVVLGCSRGSSEEPDLVTPPSATQMASLAQTEALPTPTISASPDNVEATPRPTVTASSEPGSDKPGGLAEIALSELASSSCNPSKGSSGSGFGTAPPPTVVPTPAGGSAASGDPAARAEYLVRALSIAENLSAWSTDFEATWQYDLSPGQQAAALLLLEHRTSQLCQSISLLDAPDSLEIDHGYFQGVLRARHAWIALAIDELANTGSARTELLATGRVSTYEAIEQVLTNYRQFSSGNSNSGTIVEFDELGIQFDLPAGWYVYRDVRAPKISAPADLTSNLAVEGPYAWDRGASLDIRRFGGFGFSTVAEAFERLEALISRLGEPVDQSAGSILGSEAIVTTLVDPQLDWEFTAIVAVVDQSTFVINYGCPQDREEWCDALEVALQGLTASP